MNPVLSMCSSQAWYAIYIFCQDCESDGIVCTVLDFEDNQECLDLFEKVLIWFSFLNGLELFHFPWKLSFYYSCCSFITRNYPFLLNRPFWSNVQKPLSLFSLLDEESNFAEASDLSFANKLKNLLDANHCFKGERGGAFSVRHYAGEVSFWPLSKKFWNLSFCKHSY
jgi:hypothetical protein